MSIHGLFSMEKDHANLSEGRGESLEEVLDQILRVKMNEQQRSDGVV